MSTVCEPQISVNNTHSSPPLNAAAAITSTAVATRWRPCDPRRLGSGCVDLLRATRTRGGHSSRPRAKSSSIRRVRLNPRSTQVWHLNRDRSPLSHTFAMDYTIQPSGSTIAPLVPSARVTVAR